MRQMLPTEDVESLPLSLCDQWDAVEREFEAGTCMSPFEFAAGCPLCLYVGGVGGNRFLGICPTTVLG